jgi:hypothetical protein
MTPYTEQSFVGLRHGRRFYFGEQIDPDQIVPMDIARSLSKIQRFNGHLDFDWSVLQHSFLVADVVANFDPALWRAALLHDAAEAYCGDVVQPVKALVPEVKDRVEAPIARAIERRFGVVLCHRLIKQADLCACWYEANAGGLDPESWSWDPFPAELVDRTIESLDMMRADNIHPLVLAKLFIEEVEAQ